jgi:hypothetical protein
MDCIVLFQRTSLETSTVILVTCLLRASVSVLTTRSSLLRACNVQGTLREHSGNIQGTFREYSGNTQGKCRRNSGNLQGPLRDHSGTIQGTLRECAGKIQGTFREHSGNILLASNVLLRSFSRSTSARSPPLPSTSSESRVYLRATNRMSDRRCASLHLLREQSVPARDQ